MQIENEYTGVIYCLTNNLNGKQYIGQALSYIMCHGKVKKHGIDGRFQVHCNAALSGKDSCPKLYFAMRKYGITNFRETLLGIYPIELLNYMETKHILKYDTIKKGYNIVLGNSPNNSCDKRLSRIEKIKKSMINRWKDPVYIDKTTKANLQAVLKRANEGKTRKSNTHLPPNIYKSENGYNIRIMRNGKYKITSIEGKNLSDEEKLNLAIIKRDEILFNMQNNIDDSHKKKLDHNGNELPKGIVKCTVRGNEAYRVIIRKIINGKDVRKEKTFSDKTLTMDEKLDFAKKELIKRKNNKSELFKKI